MPGTAAGNRLSSAERVDGPSQIGTRLGRPLILLGILYERMPEEVLFKSEGDQSRADIASALRTVAEKLEAGDSITLAGGGESVTMDPPSRPTFEVKAEREGPTDGPKELSVEFELEWDENGHDEEPGGGGLTIE
jgi:amphi-Trp domain-containing protein